MFTLLPFSPDIASSLLSLSISVSRICVWKFHLFSAWFSFIEVTSSSFGLWERNESEFLRRAPPSWMMLSAAVEKDKKERNRSYTWHELFDYRKLFCLSYPFVLKDFSFQSSTLQLLYFGQGLLVTTQDNGCIGDCHSRFF